MYRVVSAIELRYKFSPLIQCKVKVSACFDIRAKDFTHHVELPNVKPGSK